MVKGYVLSNFASTLQIRSSNNILMSTYLRWSRKNIRGKNFNWSYNEFIDNQDVLDLIEKMNYQMESYIEIHRDYVVVEHGNLLASSRCPYIAGLVPPLPEESSRSSYKLLSVASQFKWQHVMLSLGVE